MYFIRFSPKNTWSQRFRRRSCPYKMLYKVRKHLVSVISLQLWGFSVWTMFSSVVPYKNQHYTELKKDSIKDKKLFEDPEFPASSSSLYFKKPPPGFVEWKRPGVSGIDDRGPLLAFIRECSFCCKLTVPFYTLQGCFYFIFIWHCSFCFVVGDMQGSPSVCRGHQLPRLEPGSCGQLLVCCCLLLSGFEAKPLEKGELMWFLYSEHVSWQAGGRWQAWYQCW